jgi:ribose 5-phosphate isomerase B
MKVAIAADHRGTAARERISVLLSEMGHECIEAEQNHSGKSCDYPDTAYPAALAVSTGAAERAVLICGSGIGMSIVANKVAGCRAALCHDELSAQMSRRHNNANVLCLASDVLGEELMRRIVSCWMREDFEAGGRHERRVEKIRWVEEGKDPREYTD